MHFVVICLFFRYIMFLTFSSIFRFFGVKINLLDIYILLNDYYCLWNKNVILFTNSPKAALYRGFLCIL